MKKLSLKLFILLVIIVALDLSLSRLLDLGRPEDYAAFVDSKKGYDRLKKVDILFLGDSQTADAFVPSVFRDRLGAAAFNYGVYQLSPLEGYFLLKDLMSRHDEPPALVVLGTDVQMFHYPISGSRYSSLFIKNPMNLISLCLKSKSFGSLTGAGRKKYLLPGLVKRLLTGRASMTVRREVRKIDNGYLRNEKHFSDYTQFDCEKDRGFFSTVLVQEQREYFLKTLLYLKQRNIPLVVANLPMQREFLNGMRAKAAYQEFKSIIAGIESRYAIEVFNKDHRLLMSELMDEDFLDGDHLCYSGAKKLSAAFAEYLLSKGYTLRDSIHLFRGDENARAGGKSNLSGGT